MEIYTGIDIIEVERIQNNIENYGESFLNKIYTENEIQYCESKKANRYQSYAGRFAAKEAVFKAISKVLNNKFDISWKDIEILNQADGRPFVQLNYNNVQNFKIDISISHIAATAIASVIVTKI